MKRKINILEISSRSDIGGGPEQLFKIVANLKGHFRFYCACPDQQPYFDEIVSRNIPVFKLPYRRFEVKSFFRLLKWTRANKISVVHSHGRGAGIYARLLKIFNRKLKIVHNFHGIHFTRETFTWVAEKLLRFLTNKFIFVSETEMQTALQFGLTSISKCVLIENGISLDNKGFLEDKQSHVLRIPGKTIPPDSFVIGMLSRFDIVKNIPYAIVALSDFLKSNDNVFLVIGGDGEEHKKIEETIKHYSLQDKVILLGYVYEIRQYFLNINVYLNTSIGEAFGLSTVEAMKYGKPVVVSRVSGNIDIVDENNTGLLFSLNKPSMLVEKIKTLINNRIMYDFLAKNACESVRNRFDLNRMLRETRELYTSLIPDLSVSESIRVGINASKIFDVHTGVGRYTSNLCKSILRSGSNKDYYFYIPGRRGNTIRTDIERTHLEKPAVTKQNSTLRILWEQIVLPVYSRKDRLDLFH
ncbi:MAG: glycosyltransferase family 4 protein, partial [Candidatus Scalindua sp.]